MIKSSGSDRAASSKGRPDRPDWHGRRLGKRLRQGQLDLVENLLPRLRISADDPAPRFEATMDVVPQRLWLEIGFGGGEHLAAQARAHPDVGFIGCEPFLNGVVKLLSEVRDDGLNNIRICDDDARPLLDVLPENSFERAFVLFADPWPKTRHHKRRFIVKENLDRLARVLKDGAELHFASDHMGFLSWSLQRLVAHSAFAWTARSASDWRTPPEDWVTTRYEEKAQKQGRRSAYLQFTRLPRNP